MKTALSYQGSSGFIWGHKSFYRVIAPSDALETSLQYFAITPTL
jgi:hypothetical protein